MGNQVNSNKTTHKHGHNTMHSNNRVKVSKAQQLQQRLLKTTQRHGKSTLGERDNMPKQLLLQINRALPRLNQVQMGQVVNHLQPHLNRAHKVVDKTIQLNGQNTTENLPNIKRQMVAHRVAKGEIRATKKPQNTFLVSILIVNACRTLL